MLRNISSMRGYLSALSILAGLQLAGCQGDVASAGAIEIEGTLVLKGNEPFAQAVVVVSDSEQWALLGVDRSEIESHQDQVVRIRGQVVHEATPSTPGLPSLRVRKLSQRLTKPVPASPK